MRSARASEAAAMERLRQFRDSRTREARRDFADVYKDVVSMYLTTEPFKCCDEVEPLRGESMRSHEVPATKEDPDVCLKVCLVRGPMLGVLGWYWGRGAPLRRFLRPSERMANPAPG